MEDDDGISLAWKGFVGNHLRRILSAKVEFGEIVLEGNTFEHRLFMKKDK